MYDRSRTDYKWYNDETYVGLPAWQFGTRFESRMWRRNQRWRRYRRGYCYNTATEYPTAIIKSYVFEGDARLDTFALQPCARSTLKMFHLCSIAAVDYLYKKNKHIYTYEVWSEKKKFHKIYSNKHDIFFFFLNISLHPRSIYRQMSCT